MILVTKMHEFQKLERVVSFCETEICACGIEGTCYVLPIFLPLGYGRVKAI